MDKMILAGDIGGTKTHLALFASNEKRIWIADKKYPSADYENLLHIVKEFLSTQSDHRVERACFGIAGPIKNGKCKATNLPWIVDSAHITKEGKIDRVFLINDLEANAYGIDCLEEDELFCLNEGEKHSGNGALISAGTGLGEAGMFWDGKKFHPFACEGGHCSLAPEDDFEIALLQYLQKQFDHVSFERVLSGPGLYNIYRFLIDEGLEKEHSEVKQAMEKENPAKVISDWGLKEKCPACARALHHFILFYGTESGNLALKMLAISGFYIGGGIAPKILSAMGQGDFMKRFINKGRFNTLLSEIPVHVILNQNTALLGAAHYAREER